jgi:hypothetical protein
VQVDRSFGAAPAEAAAAGDGGAAARRRDASFRRAFAKLHWSVGELADNADAKYTRGAKGGYELTCGYLVARCEVLHETVVRGRGLALAFKALDCHRPSTSYHT